jgi:hypothetical protein
MFIPCLALAHAVRVRWCKATVQHMPQGYYKGAHTTSTAQSISAEVCMPLWLGYVAAFNPIWEPAGGLVCRADELCAQKQWGHAPAMQQS